MLPDGSMSKEDGFPHPDAFATMTPSMGTKFHKKFNVNRPKRGKLAGDKFIEDLAEPTENGATQDQKTTVKISKVDKLYFYFTKNGGNTIVYNDSIQNDEEALTNYVTSISNISNAVGEEVGGIIKQFNERQFTENPGIVVGDETNPFALFLLFYYARFVEKRGGLDKTERYIANIQTPEVKEAVENLLFGRKEGNSAVLKINSEILNPIGLDFYDEISEDGLNKIVSVYFATGNIQPIKDLNININSEDLKRNAQYLGESVLVASYICNFSRDRAIDELKNILIGCFAGEGNFSIIRSVAYRSRYDKGSGVFNKMAKAYNSNVSGIFDLLNSISLTDVHNAVKNVVKTFGVTDNIEAFRAALNAYGNFELPPYDSEASLTPAERFILFARNTCELLESKVAEKYGSYTILNPETIFMPAGEGLELLKGDTNFNRLKENRTRRQLLENIYADESKKTEEWNFCDLLSDDYFAGDKTQRAIYYFFKSNSDPNSSEWKYEFNRGKKENRVDNELGNQSIDIMCHYGDSKEKTACFEYEGEQHFRPRSVRPNDVLVDTFAVRFYNELKNNILNRYIEAFQHSGSENKWESIDVYDSIMKEEYNNSFNKLAGVPFKKAYDMVFKGYNLKTLSNLNYSKNRLNEAAADRDYTVDELLAYMFVLLCNWENLRLPDRYAHLNFPNIYGKVSLNSSIPYLGSPKRYVEELHVYHQKISDKQKSDILKSRNWVISYIVPGGNSITQEDFDEIKPLANPEGAVFRWRDDEKESILNFMKEIGIPVIENETISESLFEEIVKELLRGNSLQ